MSDNQHMEGQHPYPTEYAQAGDTIANALTVASEQTSANLPVAQSGESQLVASGQADAQNHCPTSVSSIARTREELAEEVFRRIAAGESMNAICKEEGMPSRVTILRWCGENTLLAQAYTVALQMRSAGHAELLEEDMDELDRAKDPVRVAALKVKINTRQWIMSRLLPKQYGDHQVIEHTGEVKYTSDQLDQRLKHLIAQVSKHEQGK